MRRRIVDKLERWLGRFAVPQLTTLLIAIQVTAYVLSLQKPDLFDNLVLVPQLVLAGQYWRLFTVLAVPPVTNPLFAFFFWYFFYLMGTALESHWGTFRYNGFLLVGYVATVAAAFLTPGLPTSNGFLYGSVFLAFAYLYPEFVIYLFFILPVKIKWLALLAWIGYGWALATSDWASRVAVLASVANFLLFFGEEIVRRVRTGQRRMTQQARSYSRQDEPFHRCRVCGITDKSHPGTDFRYCSQCAGTCGYCPEHIRNHEHVMAEPGPGPESGARP